MVRCGAGFAVGDESWFRRYPFGAIRASLRHPGRGSESLWHLTSLPPLACPRSDSERPGRVFCWPGAKR